MGVGLRLGLGLCVCHISASVGHWSVPLGSIAMFARKLQGEQPDTTL